MEKVGKKRHRPSASVVFQDVHLIKSINASENNETMIRKKFKRHIFVVCEDVTCTCGKSTYF